MHSAMKVIGLVALGASIRGSPGRPAQAFFLPAQFTSVPAGVHWSGFDAPANRDIRVTGLLWNQQVAQGIGTARFEVLNQSGAVVCFVDVDCAGAPGLDTRSTCDATIPAGEHSNLQPNAGNTCSPDGVLQVKGEL